MADRPFNGVPMTAYRDIIYDVGENAVRITINRPDVMNAFRLQTVEERA